MRQHKRVKGPSSPKRKPQFQTTDDLFESCLKRGLIEKTEYGYYFTPEFFETLEIYEE